LSPKLSPSSQHLRFEPAQDPERLGVALEPADVLRPVVQCPLAVVPEGRVTDVVAEAGRVDDVRRQLERDRELAADLGHFERVRQPVAREVGGAGRAQHLRLGGEAPQRGGVQHACPIAREAVALRSVRLGVEALGVVVVVTGGTAGCHSDARAGA
jgi:hypothetical protein